MDTNNNLTELQAAFAGLSTVRPHKLVEATKKQLKKAKADDNGILVTEAMSCLDIRVSRPCVDRALNLLNTLFAALEQRGFTIESKGENKSARRVGPARPVTCLKMAGEEVQVHIEEKLNRTTHVLTDAEKKMLAREESPSGRYGRSADYWQLYSWQPPEWDYQPSGQLHFKIDNLRFSGLRQNWSEGTDRQLENSLPAIAYHIIQAIAYLRQQTLERQERERHWVEEERQRAEREQQRLEEQRKAEHLDKLLGRWSRQKEIMRFLGWLDENIPSEERTEDYLEWYEWAKSYAQRLDPLATKEFYKPEQFRYWY